MSSIVIFRFWPPVASEVGYEVVWFPEFEVAEQLWSSAKTKKCFLPRIASASKSNFWPRVASEVEYAVDSRLLINFGIQLQPQKCILWWIDQCFGLWWPLVASGGLRGRNWIYFVCWKLFQFLASSYLTGHGAILKISNIHTPWVLAWKLKWNISRHLQTLCCKSLPPFVIFRANIATTTFFIIRFKMAKRWRINTTLFSQVGG